MAVRRDLYAHRYGFQPDGHGGKSVTELEYEWAVDAGIPVLLFVVDDQPPVAGRVCGPR